jgi:hypothetical protein
MSLEKVLNEAIELIVATTPEKAFRQPKSWTLLSGQAFVVNDFAAYNQNLEAAYQSNESIAKRFSRKTIYDYIDKRLIDNKKKNQLFTKEDAKNFFQTFLNIPAKNVRVLAPISGIRLEVAEEFELGIFKIGYERSLEMPMSGEDGLFISAPFFDIYDTSIALEKSKNVFTDFMRLLVFMAGRYDGAIAMKIGLPRFSNVGSVQMHTESHAYVVLNEDESFCRGENRSEILERLPVNADFFARNTDFHTLIELYGHRHKGEKINEMQGRILNAALAVGESIRTVDQKNSIIYCCIALETLFSYDDGSLFQKSIGDRLADSFAFLAGTDLDSRLHASKLTKHVYRMRSALVHGGEKYSMGEHTAVNQLNRAIIKQLLNDKKFSKVTKIDHLYEMIKTAQYSYTDWRE